MIYNRNFSDPGTPLVRLGSIRILTYSKFRLGSMVPVNARHCLLIVVFPPDIDDLIGHNKHLLSTILQTNKWKSKKHPKYTGRIAKAQARFILRQNDAYTIDNCFYSSSQLLRVGFQGCASSSTGPIPTELLRALWASGAWAIICFDPRPSGRQYWANCAHFLRKRSSRTTSPPPAGRSGLSLGSAASPVVSVGAGTARGGAVAGALAVLGRPARRGLVVGSSVAGGGGTASGSPGGSAVCSWVPPATSNCRANFTDGSKKPLT